MKFSRFGMVLLGLWSASRLGSLLKVLASGPHPQILIQQDLGGLRNSR